MDVLEELRYATYSANFVRGEEGFQLLAFDLLRMATIGGARALGLESEIGTIEQGKRADVIVLNLDDAQLMPNTNYFETIVYRAKSRNLTHTIVDGRIVYADGRLQLADQEDLLADGRQAAAEWLHRSEAMLARTGVNVGCSHISKPRWRPWSGRWSTPAATATPGARCAPEARDPAGWIGERERVAVEDRLEHRRPEDIAARDEFHIAVADAFGIARVALQ